MNLQRYCHRRLVVLRPTDTALEAARAMTENNVGTVLVADRSGNVGIVTDRDLVARVLAERIDPGTIQLGDVVGRPACAADVRADVEEVTDIMEEERCRRVPIVDDGRLVGLVTLDDLLRDGAIDAGRAADVVAAQVRRAGRPGRRTRSLDRHMAHAAKALSTLLEAVKDHTGIAERAPRQLALEVVLRALCRRIRPEEARNFVAQLPSLLQPSLLARLDGPQRWITRRAIEDEVARKLGVNRSAAASIVKGVTDAVADCVSPGAIDGLIAMLPWEMKTLFGTLAPRQTMHVKQAMLS